MKKRVLSLLIALCLVVGLFPSVFAATLDNGLEYSIVDDHVVITDYTGSDTEVVIPDEIEGLPVTTIGNGAFYWCDSIENIVIPNSVTTIYRDAFFECTSLKSITIPNSVTELAMEVFYGCESLEEAVIGSGVTEISDCLFQDCPALASVQLPEIITSIGEQAFSGCTSLRSIELPDTVTAIKAHAFFNSGLEQVIIPASVQTMGGHSLTLCDNLTKVFFEGNAPELYKDWCGSNEVLSSFNYGCTAYYSAENETWTDTVRKSIAPYIIWKSYNPNNPFTDVPTDSFYYDPVMWAIEKGITNGLTADTFGPNATCNRAQVVTFLWRAAGCPEPTSTENPFVDVQSGSFYEKPVLWAVEKGITNGADATHFNPTGVCNRAQVVTFLYRAFESPAVSTDGLPFTDVPAGAWYEAPIAWAVENGITNGLSATEFGPNVSCNRAQVVTFLYRAYND